MRNLSIDLETFSTVDLPKCGVYRYVESPEFEVLLFGCSVDGGPVVTFDLKSGETVPPDIVYALTDDSVTKWAYNAAFERICLSKWLGLPTGTYLDPSSWRCTMVWASHAGLPLPLKLSGAVLGLPFRKMDEGASMIRLFCRPCRSASDSSTKTRILPSDRPADWRVFKAYNIRDVEVECAIKDRLRRHPVSAEVWDQYITDQRINDRGIKVDIGFMKAAISMDETAKKELVRDLNKVTGLDNPNSVVQMKGWLKKNGIDTPVFDKKTVLRLLSSTDGDVKEVLGKHLALSKSSVSKYKAMERSVCSDSRLRGCFQFYGAGRTGRWAGRIVQLQNLPQNHITDLAEARDLVRSSDYGIVKVLYDNVPEVLSQLVRTAFISGTRDFMVADFSAVEARVIAWYAKELWRIKAFKANEDIYCASASRMFNVPVEKHGVNSELRQKGKIAELALGYGGSVGALVSMGAVELGLDEDELPDIVRFWRDANPNIVRFWWDIDHAAKDTLKTGNENWVSNICFQSCDGMLSVTLPSGRSLFYRNACIGTNRFGSESIEYYGTGTAGNWVKLETYGPKLAENIVQATSRDLLAQAIERLKGLRIVAHVHDEVIVEDDGTMDLDEICRIMAQTPPWAKGLVLRADGYRTPFYMKD